MQLLQKCSHKEWLGYTAGIKIIYKSYDGGIEYENVYIVYILSPLITTDFRISDGILKVVNAIIAFNNNNERQTFGPFQRRRTYRVKTRGQDAILSY